MEDPLVEAAYEELPDTDKLEFNDIKEVLQKKKIRLHNADRVVQKAKRMAQPNAPAGKRRRTVVGGGHSAEPTSENCPSANRSDAVEPPQMDSELGGAHPQSASSSSAPSGRVVDPNTTNAPGQNQVQLEGRMFTQLNRGTPKIVLVKIVLF